MFSYSDGDKAVDDIKELNRFTLALQCRQDRANVEIERVARRVRALEMATAILVVVVVICMAIIAGRLP